jgi:hypothetical protein
VSNRDCRRRSQASPMSIQVIGITLISDRREGWRDDAAQGVVFLGNAEFRPTGCGASRSPDAAALRHFARAESAAWWLLAGFCRCIRRARAHRRATSSHRFPPSLCELRLRLDYGKLRASTFSPAVPPSPARKRLSAGVHLDDLELGGGLGGAGGLPLDLRMRLYTSVARWPYVTGRTSCTQSA